MNLEDLFSSNITVPIIVAFVGFLVAVTTAIIAKEHKVSEFRQAWIDALREESSIFISSIYDCIFALTVLSENIHHEQTLELENDFYNKSFKTMELASIKLQLRLNPEKDKFFINCVDNIQSKLDKIAPDRTSGDELISSLEEIQHLTTSIKNQAHLILKNEWEIVKKGESLFLKFKYVSKLLASTFLIAMYVLFTIALLQSSIFQW